MALVQNGKMKKSDFVKHQKRCTVLPHAHLKGSDRYAYGKPEPPFEVFRYTDDGLVFPRFYANENISNYTLLCNKEKIKNIDLNFSGDLREHQVKAVECISKSYDSVGGALLCLGCGLGKTVVATHIIHKMKMKTAVIVHKEFLLNQWRDRIQQFLPGARIGRVQGNVQDVEDKDIVLVMLQSLSQRDYVGVFDDIGQLIVDECHHIAAKVFSGAMFKIPTLYTLGLSATPDRKDGLKNVIHWFLGPTVLTMQNLTENDVEVHTHDIELDYPEEVYKKNNKICLASMITNLAELKPRNDILCNKIIDIVERSDGDQRKILVLSDRTRLLKSLKMLLNKEGCSAELYIGGMKEDKLRIAEEATVILSTYSMTAEGFDNPRLNTLVFATPKTDIEQAVGRILRKKHEINPIIVDFIDRYSLFPVQYYQRKYFYKNRKFKVSNNTSKKVVVEEEDIMSKQSMFIEDDE